MKKFLGFEPALGLEFRTLLVETGLPSAELTWLFTHCRAIGMTKKSDSGKWEDDIALFTIDLLQKTKAIDELLKLITEAGNATSVREMSLLVIDALEAAERIKEQS